MRTTPGATNPTSSNGGGSVYDRCDDMVRSSRCRGASRWRAGAWFRMMALLKQRSIHVVWTNDQVDDGDDGGRREQARRVRLLSSCSSRSACEIRGGVSHAIVCACNFQLRPTCVHSPHDRPLPLLVAHSSINRPLLFPLHSLESCCVLADT